MRRTMSAGLAVALSAAFAFAAVSFATAQSAPPIKRTPLQKFDVPGTNYETIIGIAEIAPNVMIGRHTHPGVESGYVLEGEAVLIVAGQPDRTIKAGDSYQIGAGAPHDAKSGAQGAKVIATYVVEKGKPLATPAP
ncbi:MAG: cupin domain-containing protein [Variibacter sp.]